MPMGLVAKLVLFFVKKSKKFQELRMFSHRIDRMEVYRGGTNMIKEFQIGIEGPKRELLDFIHDFFIKIKGQRPYLFR